MAFNAREDCSLEIQRAVGLARPNIHVPRRGNRSCEGESGYDIITSRAHENRISQADALLLLGIIPDAVKDNPASPAIANAVGLIAEHAGRTIPDGCADALQNGRVESSTVSYYWTPAGPIVEGIAAANKFICFLYRNMDRDYRIKWYNLTGREQWEWYRCWISCGRDHNRREPETRGLAGTDLHRIVNRHELEAALTVSPSLAERRRPSGHTIEDRRWRTVVRSVGPRRLNFEG
jgi:hypothetical protein